MNGVQESIYSAEKDVQQMNSRVQREQEDLQRRAANLADSGLKQEAEAQRLQLERRSWQEGEAERSRLDAAARESKQQAQHLKVTSHAPDSLTTSCLLFPTHHLGILFAATCAAMCLYRHQQAGCRVPVQPSTARHQPACTNCVFPSQSFSSGLLPVAVWQSNDAPAQPMVEQQDIEPRFVIVHLAAIIISSISAI